MNDPVSHIKDVEDRVFTHFDLNVYERCLYYHLVVRSFDEGVSNFNVTLSELAAVLNASEFSARKSFRSLGVKGLLQSEIGRSGFKVSIIALEKLNLPTRDGSEPKVSLGEIDFFLGRKYVENLLHRENHKCFYCLTIIDKENCDLDHIISQANDGDNSFKNIVCTCLRCNKTKQASSAQDWVRSLYRSGFLSDGEFRERLDAIDTVQSGNLVPQI